MEKKYNGAVLFFLISAVGMLIIEQYNSFLFHFLVEIAGVFIGILIFIIAINSRMYSERSVLLSVGVAYLYVCIFDFVHLLSYEGFSLIKFDLNITTQLWLTARIIEAMSLVTIFTLAKTKRKINYPATHIFLIGYTVMFMTLIFTGYLPPVYNGENVTFMRYFSEGFIVVTLLYSVVLARKVEMRKDIKVIFIAVIALKIITEVMYIWAADTHSVFTTTAHVLKYLSFGGIYMMFVHETIHDPYANVYRLFASKQKELTYKAERDSLTGIYNHSTTFSKVEERIANLEEHETLVVILIDVDDFKKVNDKHGHQIGDLVLKEFSQILLTCEIDNKVVGRYGGDEFIVSGTGFKRDSLDMHFALIKSKMDDLVQKTGVHFTFSAGIAFYQKGDHTKDLIYKADIKMYEAKRLGKNQYVVW